uniref:Uncharacterized protein n=1 Tax=Anopheles farauti TaxID=69004 RepID=A0A182QH62_9DIPT
MHAFEQRIIQTITLSLRNLLVYIFKLNDLFELLMLLVMSIMAPALPFPLSTDETDRSSRPTRSMMNSSHALLPVESRSDDGLARLCAVSYSTQIVPFSPIRYDTSSGSIQIVSSRGSNFRNTTVFSPTAWPAFSIIGSIFPLMRRQRKPDPLVGTSGYQWHWK